MTCSAGLSPAAKQLLAQLAATDATTSNGLQQQVEPHFGTRLAAQFFQRAEETAQQQLPSVHMPEVPAVELPQLTGPMQMPSVQLPQVQLPTVQMPNLQLPDVLDGINTSISNSSAAAASTTDALAHLPERTQQQLQLLLTQLQELNSSNSSLEPHFGSRALLSWLQSAAEALASALQSGAGALSLPDMTQFGSQGIDISNSPAVLGTVRNSILDSVSQTISMQGFTGVSSSAANNLAELTASLQALSASAAASLPSGISQSLAQGANLMQQQTSGVASGAQQLQAVVLQLIERLQQLPETGAGGYSFATLCLISAGALAAVAASVPPAGGAAGVSGDEAVRDVLTHEYDPAAVEAYFKRRPVLVAQRSLQLALEMTNFGIRLLGDLATNRLQVCSCARPEGWGWIMGMDIVQEHEGLCSAQGYCLLYLCGSSTAA